MVVQILMDYIVPLVQDLSLRIHLFEVILGS